MVKIIIMQSFQQPPSDLPPEILRYLLTGKIDIKSFLSSLINEAENGFITVEKRNNIFYLNKSQPDENQLVDYKKKILSTLFKEKNLVSLSPGSFNTDIFSISDTYQAMRESIHQLYASKYFSKISWLKLIYLVPCLILTFIVFVACFSHINPEYIYITLAMTFLFRRMIYVTLSIFGNLYLYQSFIGIRFVIGNIIFSIIPIFSIAVIFFYTSLYTVLQLLLLALFFYISLTIFSMRFRNAEGIKLLKQIKEFKLFLLHSINTLNKTNNPEQFYTFIEKYLSYLFAFDIEIKLSDSYKNVFNQIKNSSYTWKPQWYTGVAIQNQDFISSLTQQFSPALIGLLLTYYYPKP